MQFGASLLRCTIGVFLAVVGSGCGDGLTKGRAAAALEKSFTSHDVCWATRDMARTRFPLRVNFNASHRNGNAILGALAQSGLITLSSEQVPGDRNGLPGRHVLRIDLTDAGRNANAWHERDGFCVGTRAVNDILQWTEPMRAADMTECRVSYTWRMSGVPAWAKGPAFATLQGMDEPAEATATLRKMNDGWAVVH